MRRLFDLTLILCLSLGAGCGDDGVEPPGDPCELVALPLAGNADAPVVTDVGLEVQSGSGGIVVVATATDPQGFDDVSDVIQSIGVFPDPRCQGQPLVVQDDLGVLGQEETFGTVVDPATDPALFDAIAGADRWPVEVDFRDAGGNRTTGRVSARVIR